jgi:hypothetical protein
MTETKPNRKYYARFVRAGRARSSGGQLSDVAISSEALRIAAQEGLFDHKAVFIDHAGWLEYPSLERLVGVTAQPAYNARDESIEGMIELYGTRAGNLAAALVDEMLADPQSAPDVGLSIVFYPIWADHPGPRDAENPRLVTGIAHVESVDLVFEPAADGRILQALSAPAVLSSRWIYPPDRIYPPAYDPRLVICGQLDAVGKPAIRVKSIPAKTRPYLSMKGNESMTTETPVIDAVPSAAVPSAAVPSAEAPAPTATPTPAPIPTSTTIHMTTPTTTPITTAWLQAAEQAAIRSILQSSGLPQSSRDRLALAHYNSPDDLNTTIAAERAYLASLQSDQVIQIGSQPPRGSQVTGMMDSLDRVTLALDALINGTRPERNVQPLTGIRELYHLLSGDYEMTGLYQPERINFANVTSSTMANLVANVLNKRVMNEFAEYPRWWEPIVIAEDFNTLQQVKWITLGGVGELPTVAEGATYTELTWDDAAETATFTKKGGYLGITLETIDKDDTSRVRAAPRALAQAAWLTLSKAISYIFTQSSGVGPTMSDSLALFHSTHANLGTTALSITTFNAARLAMRKQTELNSSERLGALTAPKFLLVPPDLEVTALQVLASEGDYLYALSNGVQGPINVNADGSDRQTRLNLARQRVIVVDLWTDTNDWAAVCDPRMYPTIGLAFRYGRIPEIFSVASPNAGLMFTNDTMPVKVRFFFATGPIDYRGLYKANVS